MLYQLYSIYDKVAGLFSEPFCAANVGLAVRRFNYLMSNSKMVASDCQLYKLGEVNLSSGLITAPVLASDIEFICNYAEASGE